MSTHVLGCILVRAAHLTSRVPCDLSARGSLVYMLLRSHSFLGSCRDGGAGSSVTSRSRSTDSGLKESTMKISTVWGGNKAARKRKRPVQKLKIRWDVLGLQSASSEDQSPSIDDIRRQVTSLASAGFGAETRSRSASKNTPRHPKSDAPSPNRARSRGATK